MNSTIEPIFIDTNVLVYARDRRSADKRERARAWLAAITDFGCAHTNLQVLTELTPWILKNEPERALRDIQDEVETIGAWGRARSVKMTPNWRGSFAGISAISGSTASWWLQPSSPDAAIS